MPRATTGTTRAHPTHSVDSAVSATVQPVETALIAALASITVADSDAAAVALAHKYAQALDSGHVDWIKIGPALLTVLESLMLTPRARAIVARGGVTSGQPAPAGTVANPIDQVRQQRLARQHRAAHMDAATA